MYMCIYIHKHIYNTNTNTNTNNKKKYNIIKQIISAKLGLFKYP